MLTGRCITQGAIVCLAGGQYCLLDLEIAQGRSPKLPHAAADAQDNFLIRPNTQPPQTLVGTAQHITNHPMSHIQLHLQR